MLQLILLNVFFVVIIPEKLTRDLVTRCEGRAGLIEQVYPVLVLVISQGCSGGELVHEMLFDETDV